MLDFLTCDTCDWEYHITDIFCSGCGKDISNLEVIYPISKDFYIYKSSKKIDFKLNNKSERAFNITSFYSDTSSEIFSNFSPIEIEAYNTKAFFLELLLKDSKKNMIGKKLLIQLTNNFEYPLEYSIEILKDPEITISIDGNEKKESIFFIDENSKEINISISFSSEVILENFYIGTERQETELKYSNNFSFKYKIDEINEDSFDLKLKYKILNFKEEEEIVIKIEKLVKDQIIFQKIEPTYFNDSAIRIGTSPKEINFIFKQINNDLEILKENIYFENSFIKIDEIEKNEQNIILKCLINPKEIKDNELGIITSRIGINYKNNKTNQELKKEIKFDIEVENEKYLKYPLVIDFGTSNTSVAWIENQKDGNFETQKIRTLEFFYNPDAKDSEKKETQPTMLYFTDNTNIETSAYHFTRALQGSKGFKSSIFGWKKFFGSDYQKTLLLDTKFSKFNVTDLTEKYLERIIEIFKKESQLKPNEFVFTYPATYDSKKHILLDSMLRLGYDEKKIKMDLNESNAIAYYIALENDLFKNLENNKKKIFVIFDFGGGTLDITFTSIEKIASESLDEDGFPILNEEIFINILDSSGPEKLGGDYLDFKIAKLKDPENNFFNKLEDLYKIQINNENEDEFNKMIQNINEARDLKHNNYSSPDKNNPIYNEDSIKNEFIKEGFKFLKESFENLKKTKSINELDKIDYVFLCGNSSKLDLVEINCKNELEDILNELNKNIIKINDLKLSVVKGACKYYSHNTSNYKLNGLKSLPITIGYENGGKFYTFKSSDERNSSRGINFEKVIELRTLHSKIFNTNSNKEKIYFSFLTSNEVEGKNIIDNSNIGLSTEFIIPEEIIGKEIRLSIEISDSFPIIKIRLIKKNEKDGKFNEFSHYIDLNLRF